MPDINLRIENLKTYTDVNGDRLLRPALRYKKVGYRKLEFGSKRYEKDAFFIKPLQGKKEGFSFHTGLFNRVLKHCHQNNYILNIEDHRTRLISNIKSNLDVLTLRPDQIKAVENAVRFQRGVILFPTGTGKTRVAAGIMHKYTEFHRLYLCHSESIISQAMTEFETWGFKTFRLTTASNNISDEIDVCFATIQSFRKLKQHFKYFDVVIVDEAHHCRSLVSKNYGQTLTKMNAPVKIGFTATLPTNHDEILACEALLGPVIVELSVMEASEKGILVKPKIKLIPIRHSETLQIGSKTYGKIYDAAIVNNRLRNSKIVSECMNLINGGNSVLVLTEKLEHGMNLLLLFKRLHQMDVPFVHGEVQSPERDIIKAKLIDKKILCVISSRVWKEGINIPSLNCVINACGGKAEIPVLQAAGRGLRTFEGKDHLLLIDFLDAYRYLAEHSVLRLSTYVEMGWI